jgi:hypothetical protein
MLIVGSKALKFHFPNLDIKPKDIDLIGFTWDVERLISELQPASTRRGDGIVTFFDVKNTDFFDTKNIEILIADKSDALKSYLDYEDARRGIKYASTKVLYSLKKSHIHFPLHFDKHIKDYVLLNKHFNGVDKLKDITKLNYKETEQRIGKLKTPSLNKKITEFFGQSEKFVEYYFIHDDIHKMVAHKDKPLYLYMQKDITMAKCEKDMWNEFSFEDKCKCVLEEAYVIALERKILPSIFGGSKWISSKEALNWSLKRICTTLCSGWFRQFATDNYFEIKSFINENYVEDFLEKYNTGKICRMKELSLS